MENPLAFPSEVNLRLRLGCLFLLCQALLVLQARFHDGRHFCWAPHTSMVHYRLSAERPTGPLSGEEISERYSISATGWESHSYQNLIEIIEQVERNSDPDPEGDIRVQLRYTVNGRPEVVWSAP